MTISKLRIAIETQSTRSAWERGVKEYALELVDELGEAVEGGYFNADNIADCALLREQLLNGAKDWDQYSWGGCSLIYDGNIAERLCSPSEYKRCREGERRPNGREEWLDVQARALRQAANMIVRLARQS